LVVCSGDEEVDLSEVDSYRFVSGITKRVIKTWISLEPQREIPWTKLEKPLSACKVALISSGGMALKGDLPFDQEGERQNPWWGDTSFRVIPRGTRAEQVKVYHQHIDPSFGEADFNCLLPIDRLVELEAEGVIGKTAERHYVFMGYTPQPGKLLSESVPAMIEGLNAEGVDVVLLVPA
jgi:D-proline reductase (dithiol) PrdB